MTDNEVSVTVVRAVRIVVQGLGNYEAAGAAAWVAAARELGTESLNLCDRTTLIAGGTAYTFTVRDEVRPVAAREMAYHVEDNISGRHASRNYLSFDSAVAACRALNSEPAGRGGRYGVYDRDGIRRHGPITTEGK